MIKYNFPKKIQEFIQDAKVKEIEIGCSDSQVLEIIKNKKCYFLKIMNKGLLEKEYKKLTWLQEKLPVPKIVMFTQTDKDYLITEKVDGEMLCCNYYVNNPNIAIKVLSKAFSKIYSVNISNCPFDVSINYKLNLVKDRVYNKKVKFDDLKPTTQEKFKTLENLLDFLEHNKPEEQLVFSHGDTSLPNIFATKDNFNGFIDVGDCGIADKYFDLAICEKSIRRNYGEEYVQKFYDKLNIKYNKDRSEYYFYMLELYP